MKKRHVRILLANVAAAAAQGNLVLATELLRDYGMRHDAAVRVVARLLVTASEMLGFNPTPTHKE